MLKHPNGPLTTAAVLCCFIMAAATLSAARFPLSPDAVIERYSAACHDQGSRLYGSSMEVYITAKLPKLAKQGRLHALRHISKVGFVTYEALEFEGDKTIKSSVIARYLAAEAQTGAGNEASFDVTPANYNFKYKGLSEEYGRQVYVFSLTPRKKRAGLFKGELSLDSRTYLPLRAAGRFVKNPSMLVRRIEFVREYEIHNGTAITRRIQSTIQTRLFGNAELTVEFSHWSPSENFASPATCSTLRGPASAATSMYRLLRFPSAAEHAGRAEMLRRLVTPTGSEQPTIMSVRQ
jgi:hypothetical protein